MKSLSILTTALLLMLWALPAFALQTMVADRFHIYFPEGETALADRLLTACGPMASFLENRGLPVSTPIHIVLDGLLDEPKIRVSILPHREIRIPIRAPGALEDGFTEPDPWIYYLFLGLATQGIYTERSGIPGVLSWLMGELISPNIIFPDWGVDGMAFLLYETYQQRPVAEPFHQSIFDTTPIPPLDQVSNHPDIWPGRYMYRVFGRPFIRYLHEQYGWEKLWTVLKLHGAGIIPVEIDREARQIFGMNWNSLWRLFQDEFSAPAQDRRPGLPINGYWPQPFVYWNDTGFFPGPGIHGQRSRYGYLADDGELWISEYDALGTSYLKQLKGMLIRRSEPHRWDPGPGQVAVSRRGSRPYLLLPPELSAAEAGSQRWIEAPPEVIQLSGPVMDEHGRVAVAGSTKGNWDIWLYDRQWYRITDGLSVELDPWLADDRLVFASNATGRFQIHTIGMQPVTAAATQALLPRLNHYLQLAPTGWVAAPLETIALPRLQWPEPLPAATPQQAPSYIRLGRPYTSWPSLGTNYLAPDIFVDANDFQFGLATLARDVDRRYGWDAGFRFSPQYDEYSWRLGGHAKQLSARITRYPFGYATARDVWVSELRYDYKLAWTPPMLRSIELSANFRRYWPYADRDDEQNEWWTAVSYNHNFGRLRSRLNLDWFSNASVSFFGYLHYRYDWHISPVFRLQAGKTWGERVPGHNSFRIGGSSSEGIFTQRPARLFPIRGFEPDILDASQSVTTSNEFHWPLADLQAGYRTLPVFIRDIVLVAFLDTGMAAEQWRREELLCSAGFEFITGFELAWVFNMQFRIGLAWPLVQPQDLRQQGPMFLIQIGSPL